MTSLTVAVMGAVCAWHVWNATTRGAIFTRGATFSRVETPVRFWLFVAVYGSGLAVIVLGGALVLDVTYIRPGLDHYAHLYPRQAQRQSVEGHVMLHCGVAPNYHLKDCAVGWEDHPGYGFGAAALGVASHYTLPEKDRGKVRIGQKINFPVAFKMPAEASRRGAPAGAAPRPSPPGPRSS